MILTQEVGQVAHEQLVETLKVQPFVRDLPDCFLAKLPSLTDVVQFCEDEVILQVGERSSYLYLLVSGSVCVELRTPVYALCIQALAPGDPFGWSSLVGGGQAHFQVRAREPVTVLRLDPSRLTAVCREVPEFGLALYQRLSEVMAERLAATESRLADFCGVAHSPRPRANCCVS
jgi:CRP-like cAMP-binding protein